MALTPQHSGEVADHAVAFGRSRRPRRGIWGEVADYAVAFGRSRRRLSARILQTLGAPNSDLGFFDTRIEVWRIRALTPRR